MTSQDIFDDLNSDQNLFWLGYDECKYCLKKTFFRFHVCEELKTPISCGSCRKRMCKTCNKGFQNFKLHKCSNPSDSKHKCRPFFPKDRPVCFKFYEKKDILLGNEIRN